MSATLFFSARAAAWFALLAIATGALFGQLATLPSIQYGPSNFINYETAHVHPIEETPDGQYLLAVNTAEGTIMAYSLGGSAPVNVGTLTVGLDPVTVRSRTATEAWVVNRISGTISIVDLNAQAVMATVDVCHQPGDVVFAGSPVRAVVSCTRPNKLVMIDPATRSIVSSVVVAGESPRALATSADGSTVYAAIFESGTPTTILVGDTNDPRINNVTQNPSGPWGGMSPVPNNGKLFNPPINPMIPAPPPVSTIVYKTGDGYFNASTTCSTAVFGSPISGQARSCWAQDPVSQTWSVCAQEGGTCKFSGRRRVIFGAGAFTSSGRWQDDVNGDWTSIVTGNLSSLSNRIANWDLPDRDVAIFNVNSGQLTYQTRLMNAVMALSVNPSSGQVYAVGTDATNSTRFQTILNGRFLRVNVAHFLPGQSPVIADLNPLLTYKSSSVPAAQSALSIGDPRAIAWTANGQRAYVSGMGSNNLIVIDPNGARLGTITVGQGPTGVVVDNSRGLVYVMNKFDASISVVRISDSSLQSTTNFFDPTPATISAGRKFLYDTHIGSSSGHIACASCHIDGKTDRLAWDLGDPSGSTTSRAGYTFHPMKGPFVTQTLQNMIGAPSLHHRGDRADIFAFEDTYRDLQGAPAPLDDASMTQLQAFLASLAFPPNPNRNADNTLSTAVGLPGPMGTVRAYANANNQLFSQTFNCAVCHPGSMGRSDTQNANALHLSQPAAPESMQGLYERLGMFWQSVNGSTVGTGLRPNGAHDSTFANESTTNEDVAYMLSFEGPLDNVVERSANSHPGIGLQVSLTTSGATQQSGTFCASDKGTCTFSGTREVIYGVNGLWKSGVFTGSAPCNSTIFGDPAPGSVKTCALRAAPLTLCAAQNGVCVFDLLSEVFYSTGSGPASSLVLRNNVSCSTAAFTDPSPNSSKSCYIRPASEFARLNYMLGIANTGKVGLVAQGTVGGLFRGAYYLGGGQFQTDIITDTASVQDLYYTVSIGGLMQLTLVPRGTEYRLGVDANLNGHLNTDEVMADINPRLVSAGSWQTCASESANCAFSGLHVVRFGSPGQFAYGVFNNGVACSKSIFGDPALGITKSCAIAN